MNHDSGDALPSSNGFNTGLDNSGRKLHIRVNNCDILPFCFAHTDISLGGALGAMVVDVGRELAGDLLGGIGGVAVDYNELDVWICLGLDGFKTTAQEGLAVAGRDNDGYSWP